jgi:putative two-component system response regulator
MKRPDRALGAIRIMVVDDEPPIREVFRMALEHTGYFCEVAENGNDALEKLKHSPIDVVITDIQMPGINGIELVKLIRERYDTDVIVMTGHVEDFTYDTIIELGARDFIHKPVRLTELLVRLKRVLNERALLSERNQAYREIKEAYLDTINRLVLASEYKDEDTGDHILRMSRYCALLAEKIGMSKEDVDILLYASPMHDIGKIGIPDSILLKKARLDDQEFEIMKTHTTIGARILANSKSRILESARIIALSHHEKWNGQGYPLGLEKEGIPLYGRVVALMDTFDALTSKRPYKDPYPPETACKIIRKGRELHFDPQITDAFLNSLDEFLKIRKEISPTEELPSTPFTWSERDMEEISI